MAFEATLVQDGTLIDHTPATDVAAGQVLVLGKLCLVAPRPIAANTLGALQTRGVFDVIKTTGLEVAVGEAIYWNSGTRRATKTSSDVYMGVAIQAAAAGDATVRTILRGLQEVIAEQLGLNDLSDLTLSAPAANDVLLTTNGATFINGKLTHASLTDASEATLGVPLLKRKAVTWAAAGDQTILTSSPRKLLIAKAWMVSRDANAANIKLHTGTSGVDDLTEAKAKGTVADAVVEWSTLVAAKDEIAVSGTIRANATAACAVDIFVLGIAIP